MHPSLTPFDSIYRLNSRLFLNCLEGMEEGQARWRPGPGSNSASYLALHLIQSRFFLAKLLGLDLVDPYASNTTGAKSIDDLKEIPSLEGLRDTWRGVTGSVREKLKTVPEAQLQAQVPTKLPAEDKSLLGIIAFMMQHESYHIGQLGFLRKQVGLEGMSYR